MALIEDLPEVYFGEVANESPDENEQVSDAVPADDDEEGDDAPASDDVIGQLGFNPDDLDWDENAAD